MRNSELLLQGSTVEDSEYTQSMTLAGNTKLRGATIIGEGGTSDTHQGLRLRKGGELAYVFDSTGISTLKNGTYNNDNWSKGFESTLVVDMTDAADCLIAGENRFELLVTSDKVLQDRMKNWFSDFSDWDNLVVNEDFVDMRICNEGDTYRFALENVIDVDLGESHAFVLYYTYNVPEPATCALIIGALALGFVAYRRRK